MYRADATEEKVTNQTLMHGIPLFPPRTKSFGDTVNLTLHKKERLLFISNVPLLWKNQKELLATTGL